MSNWWRSQRTSGRMIGLMGTSVEQLDKTYGYLLPDSLDRARTALDTFVARERSGVGVVPAGI
jgi:hypothetical protein